MNILSRSPVLSEASVSCLIVIVDIRKCMFFFCSAYSLEFCFLLQKRVALTQLQYVYVAAFGH